MARVFLSHSSQDKAFVRELYQRLTRDGVACFFDEESIEWGANFVVSRRPRTASPMDPADPEGVDPFGPSRAEGFSVDRYRGFYPRLLM